MRLNNLLGDTSVDYGTLMAGALMVAAPTVIVYLVLGRYFIGGLTGVSQMSDATERGIRPAIGLPARPFTIGLVGPATSP